MKISHLLPIIILLCSISVDALGNETDRFALLKFKASVGGDPGGVLGSWNDSAHFCEWRGVECSDGQRVTSLDLSGCGLRGQVSPFLGNLSSLLAIRLFNNSFSGKIPPQLGRLSRLQHLGFAMNMFEGLKYRGNRTRIGREPDFRRRPAAVREELVFFEFTAGFPSGPGSLPAQKNRTTFMFSATMPRAVEQLAGNHLKSPVVVTAVTTRKAAMIEQTVSVVKESEKLCRLQRLLAEEKETTTIVFVNTREKADQLTRKLEKKKKKMER